MAGDADRLWADSMPDAYEQWLVPVLFRPYAVELARRAAALAPARLLELAAGTGVLTGELVAALPAAAVTATDLNVAMVDFGRGQVPGATWRQADAMDLPFGANEFDLVACQFGAMFFPDRAGAYAEARRVLTPTGALLLVTWDGLERNDFAAAVVAATTRAFPDDPPRFLQSVPYAYADADVIAADLAAAGLACTAVDTVVFDEVADPVAATKGLCLGSPLRAELDARGDLDAIVEAIVADVEQQLGRGPVKARMAAKVATATPLA